jgi:hypothetical protein
MLYKLNKSGLLRFVALGPKAVRITQTDLQNCIKKLPAAGTIKKPRHAKRSLCVFPISRRRLM